MSFSMTMTREQVSTITPIAKQFPRAVNADGVMTQRQMEQQPPQREHAHRPLEARQAIQQQELYTSSQTGREWTSAWYECGGDAKICCYGTFCSCCMLCSNAQALGKSGLVYNILSCIVPCVPMFLLRQEASKQFGIKNEAGMDAMMAWCCYDCVNCQIAAEIKAQEKQKEEAETKVIEKESQMRHGD